MAYLGRELTSGNYLKLDDISSQFNGTKTTFNLTSGGNTFFPGSAFSILVSLGGVIQEPESAYILDRNQIIFAAAPQVSDSFFCIVLGNALGIGVPSDGTVTYEKLAPSGRGVGIQSAGLAIGAGVTQLNFVGAGNTFKYNPATNTIDVSIQSRVVTGNISIVDGALLTDQSIDDSVGIPTGKNGLLIGPVTVAVGVTVDISPGSTLVVV